MNAISKALDEIKFRIPLPILKEVFKDNGYGNWRKKPVSIDEQILNRVIRSRVLVDCNLVGGSEIYVSLEGLSPMLVDNVTVIYHIPKDRTQGRAIVSALAVGYTAYALAYNSSGLGIVDPKSISDVTNAANSVMMSHSGVPPMSTANVQLIAENTVMVKDTARVTNHQTLRCVIADDENMNHLQIRVIPSFCNLVELAVKSYIYNNLTVTMDMAKLEGGQELGRFKEVVDSYADAEEMYRDYLTNKWQAAAFMNDNMTTTRFIKLMIGSMK